MHRRGWTILALLSGLLGCKPARLQQAEGGLELEATSLTFPLTYVGHPTQVTLALRNTAAAARTARVEREGPPFSAPGQITVEGGRTGALTVTFDPAEPGPALGHLTIDVDGSPSSLPLSGQAEVPPRCEDPAPCHALTFDPASGRCVDALLADGTACGSACLVGGGRCQAGRCEGATLACDDADLCTADACDPLQGCVHTGLTATCPAPGDPCKTATCYPESGCGEGDAPDGTVCGTVDCTTAHVCLLGSCREVTVPEGTLCAKATPCQSPGFCQAQTCVQPAPGVLRPAWTHGVDAGVSLGFPGVLDASDDLYWTECGAACELVSTTRDGFLRYRRTLSAMAPGESIAGPGQLIVSGERVVLSSGQGRIEARQVRDGALAWVVDLASLVPPPGPGDGGPFDPQPTNGPLVELPDGAIATWVRFTTQGPSTYPYATLIIALDGADGRLAWASPITGYAGALLANERGALFVSAWVQGADAGTEDQLRAYASSGQLLSIGRLERGLPIAAANGWLFLAGEGQGAGLRFGDGGVSPLPISDFYYGDFAGYRVVPVANERIGFALGTAPFLGTVVGPYGGAPELIGFDPLTGAVRWEKSLSSDSSPIDGSQLLLTARDTALFATGATPLRAYASSNPGAPLEVGTQLIEVDASGATLYACDLPDAGAPYESRGGSVLGNERWFIARDLYTPSAQIQAYDVPGARPAPSGWTGRGGSPGQGGHPR